MPVFRVHWYSALLPLLSGVVSPEIEPISPSVGFGRYWFLPAFRPHTRKTKPKELPFTEAVGVVFLWRASVERGF
jgi:hypothetical protein